MRDGIYRVEFRSGQTIGKGIAVADNDTMGIAKECLALVIGEGHADVIKEVKPNSISESSARMLKTVQQLFTRSDCTVYLVE
jgi:hypothetical protein